MSAQLIESSPVEPLVVGVHLYPGDTWFREVHVRSVTTQAPVDLSGWVFEARLGEHVGVVDASRAAEGRLAVTFAPEQTADAAWGDVLTVSGTLAGGRRTFLHGAVGAAVGSSIPVGSAQKTRVVSSDVDISVYAAPRGDKGQDGSAVSVALVQRAEGAEGRAVSAADAAKGYASSARADASLTTNAAVAAQGYADEAASSAWDSLEASAGVVAARDAAAASATKANTDADRAGTSAFNAAGSAAAAQSSEDDARGFRDGGKAHRDAAEGFKTAAETAKTGAEAARDLALAGQFAGSTISSSADLNSLMTPGVFRQTSGAAATKAKNYPIEGGVGTLWVIPVDPAGPTLIQQWHIGSTSATARGLYQRRLFGGTWTPWYFLPMQTISAAAGQPGVGLSTWDDVNSKELALTPAGIELGTVDLNAVTLAGSYRQRTPAEATTARNYPIGNVRVVLEVLAIESNLIEQRLTIVQGHASAIRGHYVRRNNYGTWEAWTFFASQRVDQTAGRALYTWDDVNGREQLVYGDTGWRDIAGLLINGWSAAASGGVRLRRQGAAVSLRIAGMLKASATAGDFLDSITGFRSHNGQGWWPWPEEAVGIILREQTGKLAISSLSGARSGLYGTFMWLTDDPWPTVLPGTAGGAISNA